MFNSPACLLQLGTHEVWVSGQHSQTLNIDVCDVEH